MHRFKCKVLFFNQLLVDDDSVIILKKSLFLQPMLSVNIYKLLIACIFLIGFAACQHVVREDSIEQTDSVATFMWQKKTDEKTEKFESSVEAIGLENETLDLVSDVAVLVNNRASLRLLDDIGMKFDSSLTSGKITNEIQLQLIEYESITSDFYPEALTSLNAYLWVEFDNDIFTNKDYYFTNGAAVRLIHPSFRFVGLSGLMPGLGIMSLNYYEIGIRQNMYTGLEPEAREITYGDRPFAGVFLLNFTRTSIQPQRKISLSNTLITGILGSYSLAGAFQTGFHDLPPTGWNYQINNDVVLNFQSELKVIIVQNSVFTTGLGARLRAGTLWDDLSINAEVRIGKGITNPLLMPVSKQKTIEYQSINPFHYWFSIEVEKQFIAYNGTLQGGIFNKTSPYTLNNNQLSHFINKVNMGLNFYYRRNGLVLAYTHLSPEILTGRNHSWGSIRLIHNF